MKYHNKNILLIFIAILLIGGSFIFAEYRNKKAENIYNSEDVVAIKEDGQFPQEVDIDGDGSKDWEEILFGTDPEDPKSVPGAERAKIEADLTKKAADLSQIDLISRDFFARYLELRQIGASSDKASQEDLARYTVSNITTSKPALYTLNEILIKEDSSVEAVRKYGLEISDIFKKYAIKSRNEAVITKDFIDKDDPEILKEIDPIINSYKNIINSLVKVVAPKSMELMHLDLINAMNGSLFVAQSLRNSNTDAIKGVQGAEYYQAVAKDLFTSINAIKSYFKYLGIYENIF